MSTTREECRKVSHKRSPAQDYPHPDRVIFTLLMRCYIYNFVLLITDKEGTPTCHVDFELASGRNARKTKHQPTRFVIPEKWRQRLAPNETLMLKTYILGGKVSLDPKHVEFKRPNWTVPRYIIVNIEREYPMASIADLFIISDCNGKLRYSVDIQEILVARFAHLEQQH